MSLDRIQSAFTAAILDQRAENPSGRPDPGPDPLRRERRSHQEGDDIRRYLKGDAPRVIDRRLDIHRNNVFYSLTSALADLYPVVRKLVGQDFFSATAAAFLRQRPPRRAAMVWFGDEFADFLLEFEHTANLPWLADVARLELALQQSYHAADADPLAPSAFSTLREEALPAVSVELHPSLRLVESGYPVLRVWRANQEPIPDEVIDLDSGGARVCTYRSGLDVLAEELDAGSFSFLRALFGGRTLGAAMVAGQGMDGEFNPTRILAWVIGAGLVVKISGGK